MLQDKYLLLLMVANKVFGEITILENNSFVDVVDFRPMIILVIIHQKYKLYFKYFVMSCVHVSNANYATKFFFNYLFVLYISISQKFTTHFTHLCPKNQFIVDDKYMPLFLSFQ
jgi:hypothetical protein